MLTRRVSLPKFLTGATSSSPSSERSANNSSSDDLSSSLALSSINSDDPQKECAIKVVIRARPLSDRELLAKTPVIVNVTRTSIQVINPVVFLDPTYLEAISSPLKRVTQRDLPVALSAQGISAAITAGECRTFHFDRCFGVDNAAANETEPFATSYDIDFVTQRPNQELIFDEIGRDMIESAFQGFNCTVLAYGQTGSGKTHTMVGEKTTKGKGLIPRVCEALFTAIDARRAKESSESRLEDDKMIMDATTKKGTLYSAQVSYCEIYKEKVNDLLESSGLGGGEATAAGKARSPPGSPSWNGSGDDSFGLSGSGSSSSMRRTLRVREHPTTGPFVEGLSSRPVTCYADIAEEMLAGEKLRTVASTLMNPVSSRSHAVFTITFTQTTFDVVTQTAHDKTSKISMIDLAGSERANASGTSGDRLKEGAMINKSLTTLGRVISALSKQGVERVPYRDSTLTWLLKESLGGNAKTTMIAMVSPSSDNYDETMSTLRYAESAKRVINRAVVNEDKNARIIRQLRQEIQELRVELEMAKLSPKKRSTSGAGAAAASISASITERDEFQTQLLQELKQLRSLQAQDSSVALSDVSIAASQDQHGSCTHVHKTLPSLVVDVTKHFTPGSALAYTLHEGKTMFVSVPGLDAGSGAVDGEPDAQEKRKTQLTIDTSPDRANENESPPSSPLAKQRSWSPTFLRRRSSFSSAAATTGDSSSPRKLEKRSSGSLTKRKSGSNSITKSPPSEVVEPKFYNLPASTRNDGDIAACHIQITCTRVSPLTADGCTGTSDDAPSYRIELEPLDANVRVLLNGKTLSADDHTASNHSGAQVEMRHGDQLQLGDSHFFSLYVPQAVLLTSDVAVKESEKSVESLEDLVAEANNICTKWNLHMEFALKPNDDGDDTKVDDTASVVMKKHLDTQRYSVAEWKRPMLEAKVAFLRQFDESFEGSGSIVAMEEAQTNEEEEYDSCKISSHREPDAASDDANGGEEEETKGLSSEPVPPSHRSSSSSFEVSPPSIASSARGHRTISAPTPNCIRLIGQGRIFMPPLKSYANGPIIAAIYDGAGHSIGKLYMHLQYTTVPSGSGSGEKHSERRPSLLARSASLLAMTLSPTSSSSSKANNTTKAATTSMRIHLDKIVFDEHQSMATDGVSITLKKWSNLGSSPGSGDKKRSINGSEVNGGSGTNFSTPKIPPLVNERATSTYAPLKIFQITKVFETRLAFSGDVGAAKSISAEKNATSGGIPESTMAQDDFVAFEVWGYGQLGTSQSIPNSQTLQPTCKVDFYVSVDIDEREQDGIFRPVAVKADGALRLHANQPRRLNVRVTQVDQNQFTLNSIAAVQISPSFRANCDTASLSVTPGGNKSSQWLLSPSSTTATSRAQNLPQRSEPGAETSDDMWRNLEFRSISEQDTSSRSLSASLKWDRDVSSSSRQTPECVDDEGSRSVFRIVIAVTTAWSSVPIVISKSVVTKVSPSLVTTKLKLVRELETTRMAWWARESFSREYRLGTWYTVDVALTNKKPTEDSESTTGTDEVEPQAGKAIRMVNAVVNSHVKGLQRLEMVLELEHLRQQVLKMIPFSTTEIVNKEVFSAREKAEELTFDKVTEALSTLFENGDDQEQRFEILQLQSNANHSKQQLFLRKKTRRDLLVGIKYGNVMDLSSPAGDGDNTQRRGDSFTDWALGLLLHSAYFVSEPSHLASGGGGFEMSGFLMLSTAFQLDEAAVTPLSASFISAAGPGAGSTSIRPEKPAKPVKAHWERRWFVLKRPFLYAYKTFALKEEVGVLDISKCQLLTSPSSSSSTSDGISNSNGGWNHSSSSISHSSSSSSSSSPAGRAKAPSSQVLVGIPFSFQLVCLVGAKCVVWTLQASTAPEMRAWLVAIGPLKIEAHEVVVSNNQSSFETPAITA